jgi:hypothetical protein
MELIKNVVQKLQAGFKHLPKDDINNLNPFVCYESQITLQKFQEFCGLYENIAGPVTAKFVYDLELLLIERGRNIARSPAAYDYKVLNKVETSANIYCASVVEIYILLANKFHYKPKSAKQILMPPTEQNISYQLGYENLVKSVIRDLNMYPKINEALAVSINIDMKFIAKRLLNVIDHIEKADNNNPDEDELVFITQASNKTINKIKKLLNDTLESEVPFSVDQLRPYLKLLVDRKDAIGDLQHYLDNSSAKERKVCRFFANYVSLMCCRTNYLHVEPDDLLISTSPQQPVDKETAYLRLQKFVCDDVKNRDELINDMRNLKPTKWSKYVEGFKLEKLISLITNGQTMDSFFQANDTYTEDKLRSSIILFCIYEIYKKDRSLYPYIKSWSGLLFQHVTKVYNIDDKFNAANAMQKALMEGWIPILQSSNESASESELSMHKGALFDSEMYKFTNEVYKAHEKLTQAISESTHTVAIDIPVVSNRITMKM